MQIIDKYGYLDNALDYIEKNIVSGRGLQKIAKKTRINEGLLKNLCLSLSGFSEKNLVTSLQEKLESRHSSLTGALAEVLEADISVEAQGKNVFIFLSIIFDITVDGESEDRVKIEAKIFSKNNIEVNIQ